MSILDDAIREHLELKRAHGADESELKRLEDEAFGPPQRPDEVDPLAEAPTEFLTAPSEVVEEAAAEVEGEGRRVPNIADLQEAPPEPQEAPAPTESADEAEVAAEASPPEPAIEEQPAAEHQLPSVEEDQQPVAEEPPTPDGVHTTEEREAIADQPTEMFDVQAEIDAGAGAEAESPSDEQLLDAQTDEPRLTPVEPDLEDEDDDEFFSEQRLSEELDNALEAPVTEEEPLPPLPDAPPEPEPPSEDPVPLAPVEETDEHELPPVSEAPTGQTEEATAIYDVEGEASEGEDEYEEDESGEQSVYEPETGSHDDVLEDTPEFLEDTEDDVWFEQRPPKDFDFDD